MGPYRMRLEFRTPRKHLIPRDDERAYARNRQWLLRDWQRRVSYYYHTRDRELWDPVLRFWIWADGATTIMPIIPHHLAFLDVTYTLGMPKEEGFGVKYNVQNGLILLKGISGALKRADITIAAEPGSGFRVVVLNPELLTPEGSTLRMSSDLKSPPIASWKDINGRSLQFRPTTKDGSPIRLSNFNIGHTASHRFLALRAYMSFLVRAHKQVPDWDKDWDEQGTAFFVMSTYPKQLRASMIRSLAAAVPSPKDKGSAIEAIASTTGFDSEATLFDDLDELRFGRRMLEAWMDNGLKVKNGDNPDYPFEEDREGYPYSDHTDYPTDNEDSYSEDSEPEW